MAILACVVFIICICISGALTQNVEVSPCPETLMYEPRTDQSDRWYAVVNVRTREELHGVWVKVSLDRKAELLGNWFGETNTRNNKDFLIKNPRYNLEPGPPVSIRFFVKYDTNYPPPRVSMIFLNGRTICGENSYNSETDFTTLHVSKPVVSNTNIESQEGEEGEVVFNLRPQVENRPSQGSNRPSQNNNNNRPESSTNRPTQSNNFRPEVNNRPATIDQQSSSSSASRPVVSNNNNRGEGRPSGSNSRPNVLNSGGNNNRPTESSSLSNFVGFGSDESNINANPSSTNNGRPEVTLSNEEDFFPGDFNPSRRPVVTTLIENTNDNVCGVAAQQPRPLITNGKETSTDSHLSGDQYGSLKSDFNRQWPWHVALYRSKGTDLQYICGGSLISRRHVLTAAHCVTKLQTNRPISPELLQIYLGKYSLRKLNPGVQSMIVERVFVHPEYNATVFHNDMAILKFTQKATVTDYVRPVCLWEDDTSINSVVDRLGTVVGWGYDETGSLTENLMQAQMPVVTTETCIFSNREFFSRFTSSKTYCAGFRNGTSACTGDSGGGMFFTKSTGNESRNKVWQIRGVVSLSAALQSEKVVCDTSNYIIFTDVAKYLPWIKNILERR